MNNINNNASWRKRLWPARRQIFCVLAPILLALLPLIIRTKEVLCLYVVLIMGLFWTTEILPLPVTAFIPLIAYPLLGILPAKIISKEYLPDSNFIFMGSLIMAIAVEMTNLHERVALRILLCTGTSPRWLMLGFQLATSLISMWITNTATTAMMLPILMRVILELERCHRYQNRKTTKSISSKKQSSANSNANSVPISSQFNQPPDNIPPPINVTFYEPEASYFDLASSSHCEESEHGENDSNELADFDEMDELTKLNTNEVDPNQLRIYKGLLLSVCYSASIGGTGTLVGTAPNVVMVDAMNTLYPNYSPLSFSNWMAFAIPLMLFMLFICWVWLQIFFIGFRRSDKISERAVRRILKKKYQSLGRIGYAEGTVLVCFCAQVFIWITRHPGFVTGWNDWFKAGFVTDGTASMVVAFFLFILPSKNPFTLLEMNEKELENKRDEKWETILTWQHIKDHFSWGTIFLLGGSFAMAKGVKESGLSDWFGDELLKAEWLPEWLFIALSIILATALTEFSSNVATASIFIPILSSIAKGKGANPMIYVFPVVISSSFAFMFPAGTPPNAIVFSSGLLKVIDMMTAGVVLNLFGLVTNVAIVYSGYVNLVFDMENLPANWNFTLSAIE